MTTAAQSAKTIGTAPPPSLSSTPRLNAMLALDFSYDDSSQRTVLASSVQEPPLRVIRAFSNSDSAALVHLHNVSGGLLGGDQLTLRVNVGPQASAQLTTAGATRIYRPRAAAPSGGAPTVGAAAFHGGTALAVPFDFPGPVALTPEGTGVTVPTDAPRCTQTNEIHIGQDALLEYVPDAVIPFAHARFLHRTTTYLEDGAGLFWWEILAPGREARGEIFEYERVEMKTAIFSRGRLIAAENALLEPCRRDVSSLARMGVYRYWTTFYICRAGLDPRAWLAEEAHLRAVAAPLNCPRETLWGVSALLADGLVVRGLARHGRDLTSGLHRLWNAAKLRLYARPAIPPRKLP